MNHLHFVDKYGSFTMDKPENVSYLYFPLASEKLPHPQSGRGRQN